MTLKNTDKFRMLVTNHQTIDGETDIISEQGTGSFREADGKWYIMYKTGDISVMLKIDGETVHVKRSGEYGSDIDYVKGEKTAFSYNTPYGRMDMALYTKDIKYTMSVFGGVVVLEYDLYAGAGTIENKMEIKIVAI